MKNFEFICLDNSWERLLTAESSYWWRLHDNESDNGPLSLLIALESFYSNPLINMDLKSMRAQILTWTKSHQRYDEIFLTEACDYYEGSLCTVFFLVGKRKERETEVAARQNKMRLALEEEIAKKAAEAELAKEKEYQKFLKLKAKFETKD
jgi:hypothetical protein